MHGPFREITIQYIDKSVIFVLGMSVSYIVLRSGNSTYPVNGVIVATLLKMGAKRRKTWM